MQAKPNILWIITTQWRAQACGHSGDPNARTPFMDRLAAEGLELRGAVTPHPFGPFARAAILTGIESPANGIRDYFDPLPPDVPTVAHGMRERGYETAFFGKWHLYKRDAAATLTGEDHAWIVVPPEFRGGFGFWEGFESGFLINDPWLHGTRIPSPTRHPGYQSDVLCGRAAAYLKTLGAPWFAVVSLEAPHPPYHAPAAGIAERTGDSIILRGNVPAQGPEQARARAELAGYYAHLEATDRSIGGLVGSLPADTRVVVTSAHGDMHGSHGLFRKGWPYEESVRVPLIIRDGGPPRRDDRPFSLRGLPALALAWADGREPPPGDRGVARISMPSVVRLKDQCDRPWRGILAGGRKLVLNEDGSPWLFFDLERDPLEEENLVADPSRAAELRSLAARVSP